MRRFTCGLVGLAVTWMAACATAPEVMGPPDYAAVATEPPSPRARFYADCIDAAIGSRAYAIARDDDTNLILFTCEGPVARTFYEALAERSAEVGSEFAHDGRTYRSTERVMRNLLGVDYCSTDGRSDFHCVITLNAGGFLSGG